MRRLLPLLVLAALGTAWAQPDGVSSLRELLGSGYYALAAQLEGPRVVRAHPESAEAHLLYARALYLVGNVTAAKAQLTQTEPLAKTRAVERALTHLSALVRAAEGDPAGAARRLERVFRAAPDYRVAMDWGLVAWQGGDLKTALRAYRAAAGTPGGRAEPWPSLNTARLLLQQGRSQEALTALETTLVILERDPSRLPSPAYAEAFYRRGQAHEALAQTEEAVSNYRAARSVDPDYAPASEALRRLEAAPP